MHEDMDMETEHGDMVIKTWTWRLNMETEHGDMDIQTWTWRLNMETWT